MTTCLVPQVIISSSSAKGRCNWSLKDADTGNVLTSSKLGQSSPHTLCLVGRDYLVGGAPENPIINVWPLAHPRQVKKMVVPGIVTALAVSRQGHYLVAGIDDKLHIWKTSTGNLLRVLHGHYQKVNCIKFTNDGSHFISGGNDGQTLVWTLSSILSCEISNSESTTTDVIKPSFTWKNHSAPVEDIYVGYFGCKARVLTASSDSTCKLYQLLSGHLLLSIFMDQPLRAVSMDPAERFIFLGTKEGDIHCITLAYRESSNEIHYDASNEKMFQKFHGHTGEVVCLSVSMDGMMLLSGSTDDCVKLWDIFSQTLIKAIHCEGPVTNAFLAFPPPAVRNFQNKKYEVPVFEFETLKRHLHTEELNSDEDDIFKNAVPLNLKNHRLKTWDLSSGMNILEGTISLGEMGNSKAELKEEIGSVKKMNEQMYYYLVDTFISALEN